MTSSTTLRKWCQRSDCEVIIVDEMLNNQPRLEYKPEKHGMETVFGSLESEIMELVWAKGKSNVRDIYEALNLQRGKNLAYTTVMTIMGRLAEKKVLSRLKEGGTFLYEPFSTKNEFSSRVVGKVIDSLLEDFSETTLAHFVGKIGDIDPKKLELLEELIAKRKQTE